MTVGAECRWLGISYPNWGKAGLLCTLTESTTALIQAVEMRCTDTGPSKMYALTQEPPSCRRCRAARTMALASGV
eukprot:1161230-Pelagomonas_calceolata.AAC.2